MGDHLNLTYAVEGNHKSTIRVRYMANYTIKLAKRGEVRAAVKHVVGMALLRVCVWGLIEQRLCLGYGC